MAMLDPHFSIVSSREFVWVRDESSSWLLRWTLIVLFALLTSMPLLGNAGQPDLNRVDGIYLLAESDNSTALKEVVAMGVTLGPQTPYVVKRTYLMARIEVEFDGAQIDAAAASVVKLAKLAREQNDDVGLILATTADASLMVSAGKTGAAIAKLAEIAPLTARTSDHESLSYYFRILSNAQLAVGKFEAALDSSLKGLHHAEQQEKHGSQARLKSMNSLSNVYSAMNNPQKALDILNQALALANQHGLKGMQATLYLNQGGAFSSLGRTDEYMVANERALKLSRESGQKQTEAVVLGNIGDSWLLKRNYTKAESFSRLAMEKYKETGDQNGFTTSQANVGFALMGQGSVDEGAAKVRQAIKIQQDAHDISSVEGILAELGKMYEQVGRFKEAVATIREQQTLSEQLFKAEREHAVATQQEQFDSVQRQKQLELLARENKLKDSEIRNQQLQQTVTILGALVTVMAGIFVFSLYRRARETNVKLSEANKQLEFHSVRDVLTGLFNRRSFLEIMQQRPLDAVGLRRGDDSPDGLLVLDIDHFKSVNDTLGHGAGDAVLIEVARRMRLAVRESDMIIRWGGEEFLVYSPKGNVLHIRNLAERILKVISQTPFEAGGKTITVTASGGFLCLPFSGTSETECNWEKSLQIADMALYLAKLNGRNRACGINRLLVPFAEALPLLENDLAAAVEANMIELVEVCGPSIDGLAPRLAPTE